MDCNSNIIILAHSWMFSSNIPQVDGYVSMIQQIRSLFVSISFLSDSISTLPVLRPKTYTFTSFRGSLHWLLLSLVVEKLVSISYFGSMSIWRILSPVREAEAKFVPSIDKIIKTQTMNDIDKKLLI